MRNTTANLKGKTMTIKPTRKSGRNGKGFVMFGAIDGNLAKWFERWFPSEAAAQSYATKQGWTITK